MKFKYLGTAAYEGIPALFCTCDTCREARELGGRNLRTRSQAIINDDLLLDFNADTCIHAMTYGLDFSKLDACLITHSHCDHFYPDDIEIMHEHYSHFDPTHKFHFYAGEHAYGRLCKMASHPKINALVPHLVTAGEAFTAGRYHVFPIPATHDPNSSPFVYIIDDGTRRVFYMNDTSLLSDSAWDMLAAYGKRVDLVSLDCTAALQNRTEMRTHMSLLMVRMALERLTEIGIVDDKTIKIINHFSHNGRANYDTLSALVRDEGLLVSYDGMELEL